MIWNPDLDMTRRAHDRAVFKNGGWWTVLAWVAVVMHERGRVFESVDEVVAQAIRASLDGCVVDEHTGQALMRHAAMEAIQAYESARRAEKREPSHLGITLHLLAVELERGDAHIEAVRAARDMLTAELKRRREAGYVERVGCGVDYRPGRHGRL